MQRRIGTIKISQYSINEAFWKCYLLSLIGNIIEMIELSFRGETQIANYVSYAILLYMLFAIIAYTSSNQKMKIVVAFICPIGAVFVTSLIFPNNSVYAYDALKAVYLACLPKLIIAASVKDFDDLLLRMKKMATPLLLVSWVLIIMVYTGFIDTVQNNYMKIAYDITLPISILGYLAISDKKFSSYFWFITSTAALFFIGCRGAFVVVVVFYVIALFIIGEHNTKAKIATIIGFLFIIIFFDEILYIAGSFLSSIGYDSRIIAKASSNMLFSSNGREIIQTGVLTYAQNNSFKPFGLFGDRYLTGALIGASSYMHNIVLEFIIDFGIIMGIILFSMLIIWMLYSFKKGDKAYRHILVLFFSLSIIKLMFSTSYLIEDSFYCFLGILIAGISLRCNQVQRHMERISYESVSSNI